MQKRRRVVMVGRPGRPARPSAAEITAIVSQLHLRKRQSVAEAAPAPGTTAAAGRPAGGGPRGRVAPSR